MRLALEIWNVSGDKGGTAKEQRGGHSGGRMSGSLGVACTVPSSVHRCAKLLTCSLSSQSATLLLSHSLLSRLLGNSHSIVLSAVRKASKRDTALSAPYHHKY